MRGLTNASMGGIIEIGEITTDDKSQDPNYIKLDGHLIDLKDVDDNSIIHTFEKVLGKYESTNLSNVLSSFYFKDTGLYIVVCTGLPMRLYKSTDAYNWTEISEVQPTACYFYDNILYVITYNALYKINGNGVAVRIKNISEISANCIQVDGDNIGILAVNYNNSSITAYSTTLSSSTNTQRQYWSSCDSFNSGFVKSINKGMMVVCNSHTGLANFCSYSIDCGITYKKIEQPYVALGAIGNFTDCCPTSDGIIICNCYIGYGTEISPQVLLLKYNDNIYDTLYPISGYMGVAQYMNGCLISTIKDDENVIYNVNSTITATLCSYNANGINGGTYQGFAKVHSASSQRHRLKLLSNNVCNHMIIMGQHKTPIYAKAPKYPYDAYMKIK